MDTDRLIEQTVRGDRRAFEALVRRHQDGVFAFLWRMGLRRAVVEELAQEAFVRAWLYLADYRSARSTFSTWLLSIARHLALNELDRASNRREIPLDGDLDCADAADTPPAALERKRRQTLVRSALRELGVKQRSVLALSDLGELSLAEVAALEGLSVGAVKQRLHRARAALREALEKHR